MTEHEIVEGCQKRDRKCQEELYKRFAPKMLGVCYRYAGGNLEEAEDILQEAFVKIFESIKNFRELGSLEGWVRRICVNTAINNFRKKKISIPLDAEIHDQEISDSGFSRLQETDLLKLINGIPEGYRMVFNLFAIEGYNHKEIAEMMHIEEASSRSQLARARKFLQELVNKSENIRA